MIAHAYNSYGESIIGKISIQTPIVCMPDSLAMHNYILPADSSFLLNTTCGYVHTLYTSFCLCFK